MDRAVIERTSPTPFLRPGAVPGIDEDGLIRWVDAQGLGLQPPLRFSPIIGGASNLTYRVEDADGCVVVLRRPPLHSVLPGAHDMAREYRIIAALSATEVPVPPALRLCTDATVIGAPFFLMGFVEGAVLRDAEIVAATVPPERRRVVAEALVDTLATLHAVEPDDVGLGTLGRREHYIARQLRTWNRQWHASRSRDLPAVDEAHGRLQLDVPEQQGSGIVHGDYRLDNIIVDDAGHPAAVVDWELCTLGDPLADLGLLLVYWTDPGDGFTALPNAPTEAGGFPQRRELAERYAGVTGRDLSQLGYYVAFGYWKLACILEGVYGRYASGAYGDNDGSFEAFGDIVIALAEKAGEAAAEVGR